MDFFIGRQDAAATTDALKGERGKQSPIMAAPPEAFWHPLKPTLHRDPFGELHSTRNLIHFLADAMRALLARSINVNKSKLQAREDTSSSSETVGGFGGFGGEI